ncbi:hypothetical protein BH18CHL2_BH18CHL2_08610 [soil metagenome]
MRIAVAGKGGAGKTTLSAPLARSLARSGKRVLAIDGDPNPNLGVALGVDPELLREPPRVPRNMAEEFKDETGRTHRRLKEPAESVRKRYAIAAPDGVELMLMTVVDHAGTG